MLRRSVIPAPPSAGARFHGEKPRISTGCAPSRPAACRILRERGRYRSARLVARSHDARRRLLLIFVGHPCDVGLSWIEAAPSLQELSRPARLSRFRTQLRATSVPLSAILSQPLPHHLDVARDQYSPRSLVRVTLEARVPLVPAMRLMAGWTLDRIHLLDGRCLECLWIHRETGIDHFSGRRTLDQYAVQTFLDPS